MRQETRPPSAVNARTAVLDSFFGQLILDPSAAEQGRRRLTVPVSASVHALMIAAIVVVPLLWQEALPDPAAGVRVFFAEPAAMPAPAPPPPPPAAGPRRPSASAASLRPASFVAPIETPVEIPTDLGPDLGVEGGAPGGVEGGVPGGVVGGVLGGLPDLPPAPEVAPQVVRVGGNVKAPAKVKHVDPAYPPLAQTARIEGTVILECVINPLGRVVDLKLLRSIPMLDEAAIAAVRQWVYTPTLMNGIPVSAVMSVTVRFALAQDRVASAR
jgi:periplasmic protein TonB